MGGEKWEATEGEADAWAFPELTVMVFGGEYIDKGFSFFFISRRA